ncbi:hypothetical protein PHYBOEH_002234 [Phytophthora boehmeriae]|uniref:Uncharacterized protein n=1 Tax=Phytophthora boehmeriae TaxID=109152 RepID=A0A8T1WW52_9STRA|nr:hypothetical protein PHYBOEH_002234 [Phytophthora boehmeriae]
MAASVPPSTSSVPAPAGGSKLESQAKSNTMTPSPAAASAQSKDEAPAASKPGSVPDLDVEEMTETIADAKKPTTSARRSRNAKPKKKKKVKETAQCVGYFVDALDKKMLWGEARIIQCNLSTQKIKVHFVGWSKTYDLWTDPMSITAHGRYTPITMKGSGVKSWDGDMHLFEDMLGTIEEPNFTPVPTPAESTPKEKAVAKSRVGKKKITTTKSTIPPKKATSKRKTANEETVERSAAVVAKTNDKNEQQAEQPRDKKRQKQEAAQLSSASKSTTSKTRASKKKTAQSPDELPQFRDLELDDGTVVDFSEQREQAKVERESMKSFLDKCAQIWKEQLGAVSVQ